ncbi:MAG: hypothetical protein OHK0015_54560 [Chloroflexi bacterium OHK40]
MLTYENFVSVLLGVIERTGLNIAYTQELLDTHALGRSLSITCLPDGVSDDSGPQEPPLRAVVAFRWSPEFTVYSLRGGDSLDNIERFVDERLFAQSSRGPSLAVEVTYHLPLSDDQRDMRALVAIAHTVQELHGSLVEDDEIVRVDGTISFAPGGAASVQNMSATRVWSLDEALYDQDLLALTFEELCTELQAMLQLLTARFGLADDTRQNTDGLPADRRYLKPPTA